jgi:hypothetical protein
MLIGRGIVSCRPRLNYISIALSVMALSCRHQKNLVDKMWVAGESVGRGTAEAVWSKT